MGPQFGGGLFVPKLVYGGNDGWSLSVAVRVTGGLAARRMGRYGVRSMDGLDTEAHRH